MSIPPAADTALADRVDALLPQTQCRQCGHAGCRPYAEALATGQTEINRCPPGGASTLAALAALLKRGILPLDPACGTTRPRALAFVDEPRCIGCALCLKACPVDAIVGAAKFMHTVIAAECTGCELCLPACPVDCIEMRPLPDAPPDWSVVGADAADRARADRARARHRARLQRLDARARERAELRAARRAEFTTAGTAADPERAARQAVIADALARARARVKQDKP